MWPRVSPETRPKSPQNGGDTDVGGGTIFQLTDIGILVGLYKGSTCDP
jgi:hypothetical protein